MKKKLLVGLGLSVFLSTGCSNTEPQPKSNIKKQENRVVADENNSSRKKILINLDKELKEDELKGGAFETIRGLIPMGHNDEVSFFGKELFVATPIKLYINGKLQETVKTIKGIFTIKGSEVNDGDTITIKNRFGTKLVEKRVKK